MVSTIHLPVANVLPSQNITLWNKQTRLWGENTQAASVKLSVLLSPFLRQCHELGRAWPQRVPFYLSLKNRFLIPLEWQKYDSSSKSWSAVLFTPSLLEFVSAWRLWVIWRWGRSQGCTTWSFSTLSLKKRFVRKGRQIADVSTVLFCFSISILCFLWFSALGAVMKAGKGRWACDGRSAGVWDFGSGIGAVMISNSTVFSAPSLEIGWINKWSGNA